MAEKSQRRYTSLSTCFVAIEAFATVGVILAIVTLLAGRNPGFLQDAAIVTFDTSSVESSLLSVINQNGSTAVNTVGGDIKDWYEMHYLAVCKGMWAATGEEQRVKNLSTTTCEPKNLGYTFSLGEELAVDTVSAARDILANWTYGVLRTGVPAGLLVGAICLAGLSVMTHVFIQIKMPALGDGVLLWLLRFAYMTILAPSIIITNSCVQITVKANKLRHPPTEIALKAWTAFEFYLLGWLSMSMMWAAVVVSIATALVFRGFFESLRAKTKRSEKRQEWPS